MIKFHQSINEQLNTYLSTAIDNTFKEIDLICQHNFINDFHEWFTERTFLSIYLNAQIRNSHNYNSSCIQEFIADSKSKRCDAIFTIDQKLFLIESKFQKYFRKIDDSHWDFENWKRYDKDVYNQLHDYLLFDPKFYFNKERYKKVYLQTLIFKIIEIDPIKHSNNVDLNLNINFPDLDGRGWYYSYYFPKSIKLSNNVDLGLEIFGTVNDLSNGFVQRTA